MPELYPDDLETSSTPTESSIWEETEKDVPAIRLGSLWIEVRTDPEASPGKTDEVQMLLALKRVLDGAFGEQEEEFHSPEEAAETLQTYASRREHLKTCVRSIVKNETAISDCLNPTEVNQMTDNICDLIAVQPNGDYNLRGTLVETGIDAALNMSELKEAVETYIRREVNISIDSTSD